MKKLFIIIYLFLSAQELIAQSKEAAVEVRMNLLEQNNAAGVKQLALSISLINHSDKDIYIPNFRNFAAYGGTHVYQKENNSWVEIDVDKHDYYRPPTKSKNVKRRDTAYHVDDRVIYADNNEIVKSYNKHGYQLMMQQDSIIKKFYNSSSDHHQLPILTLYGEEPLFIKAKQTLENFLVRDFDYLLEKKMDYKISFNSELRDTARYYREPKIYNKTLHNYEDLHLPEYIYDYKLYFPVQILSNTIYYSTKGGQK